jgi:hypothetical protein
MECPLDFLSTKKYMECTIDFETTWNVPLIVKVHGMSIKLAIGHILFWIEEHVRGRVPSKGEGFLSILGHVLVWVEEHMRGRV